MAIHIGTSGFIYEHWRRRFYPPAARGAELELYARTFDTVELNVTFYRMPSSATFRAWTTRVPRDFLFAVKASRYLTHVKRLKDPRPSVDMLVERARELGAHLGPILIQLPPDLEVDIAALEETLDAFPKALRLAVEPRHDSWFVPELREVLTARNAALCLADRAGPITPRWRTADWAYVRFHSGRAAPSSCYDPVELDGWVRDIEAEWGRDATGYVYFNNDFHGCALRDASVFGKALAARGVIVASVPDVPGSMVDEPAAFVAEAASRTINEPDRSWARRA